MNPIAPLNRMVCSSLKGRQAPVAGSTQPIIMHHSIETPNLPFETETLKIRRPILPKRSATVMDQAMGDEPHERKMDEGLYAFKLKDSTWAHTDPEADHYASREEYIDLLNNFDDIIETIVYNDEVDLANKLQGLTDMLLSQLASTLRAECMEKSLCVDRGREEYSRVFRILQNDSKNCRDMINDLEKQKNNLDENLTKVIDDATERVKEAQQDCERQLNEMKMEMEEKKEEYDNSMKRFLEQKAQLEEHVKALHRVFLDFQSDSVYITLEELKQKQESIEKKLRNKETEISKLNGQLTKMQKTILDGENQRAMLEQANDELRRKLQAAMATANRLQRRLEMQNIDAGGDFEDIDMDEEFNDKSGFNADGLPSQPLINSETVQNSIQGPHFNHKNRQFGNGIDSTPYITVIQKLGQVTDRIADVLQRASSSAMLPQSINEETDKIMLSGNASLMIKAIQMKTNEVLQYTECLENIDFNNFGGSGAKVGSDEPRFLQYIHAHNQGNANPNRESKLTSTIIMTVRQVFNSKYISDQWNKRINRALYRFPEFLIQYHCKDGENLFTALSRSARLWRTVKESKLPEMKLFKNFLIEKLSVDELSFFLEARHSLIGLRQVDEDDPQVINIPFEKCQAFMASVLGAFSPILATVTQSAEQFCLNGYIDYAQFLKILVKFYLNERRRRRNAVRLMFQSKSFGKGNAIDFENFAAMIQSLGFQGSIEDIFNLFREANLLNSGVLNLDSLLRAMDSLSFHFYSIEVPASMTKKNEVTQLTRQQLLNHWVRFGTWFSAFRNPLPELDTWLRSQLINQVRRVDKVFKANQPIQVLYTEYRQLLDFFQFTLDTLARSQSSAMSQQKSERQLILLENVIDLLITFIVRDNHGEILFTEA